MLLLNSLSNSTLAGSLPRGPIDLEDVFDLNEICTKDIPLSMTPDTMPDKSRLTSNIPLDRSKMRTVSPMVIRDMDTDRESRMTESCRDDSIEAPIKVNVSYLN